MTFTKVCSSCHRVLPFDSFRKQSGTKDGLQYECKDCTSGRAAQRYEKNPEILEKNKVWQQNNKEKHNEAAKKYYHSPTGRLNRSLNRALDCIFGKERESLFSLMGTSVSALVIHLLGSMPKGLKMEDYEDKWFVGFIEPPNMALVRNPSMARKYFNWRNLCVKEKTEITGDLSVK